MLLVDTIDEDVHAANEITLGSRVCVDEGAEYILVVVVVVDVVVFVVVFVLRNRSQTFVCPYCSRCDKCLDGFLL